MLEQATLSSDWPSLISVASASCHLQLWCLHDRYYTSVPLRMTPAAAVMQYRQVLFLSRSKVLPITFL